MNALHPKKYYFEMREREVDKSELWIANEKGDLKEVATQEADNTNLLPASNMKHENQPFFKTNKSLYM